MEKQKKTEHVEKKEKRRRIIHTQKSYLTAGVIMLVAVIAMAGAYQREKKNAEAMIRIMPLDCCFIMKMNLLVYSDGKFPALAGRGLHFRPPAAGVMVRDADIIPQRNGFVIEL